MSDSNEELVRRVYAAMSRGEMDILNEMLADDLVEHEELPGMERNKNGVIQLFSQMRSAFPDFVMTPHQVIVAGDMVAVRGTMAGTHEGEFMGMPGSGKQVDVPFADFFRIAGGKIAEHWGVTDNGAMMEQLGAN